MKTTYTTSAILGIALFSQTAVAKLAGTPSTTQLESNIDINVKAEIVNNINKMLANVKAPAVKTDANKQLESTTIQFQTNQLVKNVEDKLPEFKFKVIITE